MTFRRVTYPAWLTYCLMCLLVVCAGSWLIFPPPLKALNHVSPQVLDREGNVLAVYTIDDGLWRLHSQRADIDPRFVEALLAVEDERFWTHSGVDPLSILRAVKTLIKSGKAKSGASTLTMQLVRQIEPRERVLSSKIIESMRALQYDLSLTKTEILEYYLTHISYGGNIQGVSAASQIYFGKTPAHLTWSEIATLIALPQAPASRRPRKNDQAALIDGRNKVLTRLVRQQVITEKQANEARQEPLNIIFKPLPRSQDNAIASLSRSAIMTRPVLSTFDPQIQKLLEQETNSYVRDWPSHLNGAALVIHNPSREIRAIRSAFAPHHEGGWMDLTEINRSPGSTLKPFIYGLAMDEGLIDQSTLLPDRPIAFDGYQPENFDRTYYGDVRVHEALRHSLNIPAVAVMQQLGAPRFESVLKTAGVELQRSTAGRERAGLAIALGGVGMSPRDLASLYTGLANSGVIAPLTLKQNAAAPFMKTILSPSASDDITQILRYAPGPKGRVPHWLKAASHAVSYKTGTSYGFRDAWAVGYTSQWTVLIWIGRPDGGVMPGKTGRNMAAPLLFNIFETLPGQSTGVGYQKDAASAQGLKNLIDIKPESKGPSFKFPQDGAIIFTRDKSRGIKIILSDAQKDTQLYVNGERLIGEGAQWIWRPAHAGFYDIKAITLDGEQSKISVRVSFLGT